MRENNFYDKICKQIKSYVFFIFSRSNLLFATSPNSTLKVSHNLFSILDLMTVFKFCPFYQTYLNVKIFLQFWTFIYFLLFHIHDSRKTKQMELLKLSSSICTVLKCKLILFHIILLFYPYENIQFLIILSLLVIFIQSALLNDVTIADLKIRTA